MCVLQRRRERGTFARPQESRGGQLENLGNVRAENPDTDHGLERAEGPPGGGWGGCPAQVWKRLPQAHPLQPRMPGGRPAGLAPGALPVHSPALVPQAPGNGPRVVAQPAGACTAASEAAAAAGP